MNKEAMINKMNMIHGKVKVQDFDLNLNVNIDSFRSFPNPPWGGQLGLLLYT